MRPIIRGSRITGYAHHDHLFGGSTTMPLYDGAVAVPVYARFQWEAVVHYIGADGRHVRAFACCGPAAPAPYRYGETVERLRDGVRWYVIREELPDGRVRTFTREYHEHEVEAVGIETVWRGVRAQYVRQIEREGRAS